MHILRACLVSWLLLCACGTAPVSTGTCVADPQLALQCGEAADAYTGFSCAAGARPDADPAYIEGVPRGIVCAEHGSQDANGAQAYCCTARETACAFNPAGICEAGTYSFECLGANRPDALNAALRCGNGVEERNLIDYCCSATPKEPGCLQSDSVTCSPRLSGWTCLGESLPKSEQLGASKSRSDFYRLLCSSPTPAANPGYNNYCCYAPAPLPERGSCVQHTALPGCQPGRFGFACYGPDKPQDDYLPMTCPEPGVQGLSAEGYPATLYCCDFD